MILLVNMTFDLASRSGIVVKKKTMSASPESVAVFW